MKIEANLATSMTEFIWKLKIKLEYWQYFLKFTDTMLLCKHINNAQAEMKYDVRKSVKKNNLFHLTCTENLCTNF